MRALLPLAAFALISAPASATTTEIDIPAGRSLSYGIVFAPAGVPPFGVHSSLAAQSFIAPAPRLLSASIPLRELNTDEPVAWEFQLYDDDQGRPGSVFARFGSFDPGVSGTTDSIGGRQTGSGFQRFDGTATTPITLVPGQVYYLGVGPVTFDRFNNLLALGDCFSGNNCGPTDLYPFGNVWAVFDGVPLPQNDGFDLNMTITFDTVPEPGACLLLMMGMLGLAGWRRRSG